MKMLLPRLLAADAFEDKFTLLNENLREHEVIHGLNDAYVDYRRIRTEVLLMVGGKSGFPWVPSAAA